MKRARGDATEGAGARKAAEELLRIKWVTKLVEIVLEAKLPVAPGVQDVAKRCLVSITIAQGRRDGTSGNVVTIGFAPEGIS